MKYKSPFTKEIIITNKNEARQAVVRFCDYCLKDAVGQFHCSGKDAAICQAVKDQILMDFKKEDKGQSNDQ